MAGRSNQTAPFLFIGLKGASNGGLQHHGLKSRMDIVFHGRAIASKNQNPPQRHRGAECAQRKPKLISQSTRQHRQRLQVFCFSLCKLRVSAPLWWGSLFGAIALVSQPHQKAPCSSAKGTRPLNGNGGRREANARKIARITLDARLSAAILDVGYRNLMLLISSA